MTNEELLEKVKEGNWSPETEEQIIKTIKLGEQLQNILKSNCTCNPAIGITLCRYCALNRRNRICNTY